MPNNLSDLTIGEHLLGRLSGEQLRAGHQFDLTTPVCARSLAEVMRKPH